MKPHNLGLPEKFKEFRPHQLQTAAKAASSGEYSFLVDAPTGTGKTILAATSQKLLKKKAVYVCMTKQLEDQILNDFSYAKVLKGRSAYPCLKYPQLYPKVTAELCTHTEAAPCNFLSRCPYRLAKRAALNAELAVLNTAYLLSEANYVGGFTDMEYLIIDEVDSLESQLMNFIELVITQRQLQKFNLSTPKYKTKFESWIDWAEETISKLKPQLRKLETEDQTWMDFNTLRDIKYLKAFIGKLEFFTCEVDKTWVWYPGDERWEFKPVWVSKYAKGYLWKHAKKALGMSATILDPKQLSKNIGLQEYKYVELPSPFPKENRPIFFQPCASVSNKTLPTALPKIAKSVEKIMAQYPDSKILCHTVSYKIRDYLRDNIQSKRLVTHSTKDRALVLEKFKRSKAPLVLLSPSMERGIDLPQEECRVVIITKCPFPSLGDPQISRRLHGSSDGQQWYALRTISTLIQASGRAVRSVDDHCDTYILDEQFARMYTDYKSLFPQWYREAVIT